MQAKGDEVLVVLMLLGAEPEDAQQELVNEEIDPAQFPTRTAYREEAIARRKEQLDRYIGSTLKKLKALSLKPRGGTQSPTVVVEGPARQIVAALELPGVLHARLDQPIKLIEPVVDKSHSGE